MEYGLRLMTLLTNTKQPGLNPYSIGIWSAPRLTDVNNTPLRVLILILLEYGLRHGSKVSQQHESYGLNPYSIGIWSAPRPILNDGAVLDMS